MKGDRCVLITGGNRGLGLEACRQLARRGLRVILTSRGTDGAEAARRLAKEGLDVSHRLLDVSDAASIADLERQIERDRVSVSVNEGLRAKLLDPLITRDELIALMNGFVRGVERGDPDMGGPGAPRSIEEGAASIVWAAASEKDSTGRFFRDGKAIGW
jgi:NAD(P)-dependent dehydrogenase (short-subunit alcohol dehydrogenase family)